MNGLGGDEGVGVRVFLVCLLLALVASADPWHKLRNQQVKRFEAEWSDAQKGINGYHVDCFDDKDEWLGGLTFYLKDGFAGKVAGVKDLDGVNLRSPIQPKSLGARVALKMVQEFSATGNTVHFWVQGKEDEWDVDLRGDLKAR